MENIEIQANHRPENKDPIPEDICHFSLDSNKCKFNFETYSGYFFFITGALSIAILISWIVYSALQSNYNNYQSVELVIRNYIIKQNTCDFRDTTITCYDGYLNLTYNSIICQTYITTRACSDVDLITYLNLNYKTNKTINAWINNNQCYFNVDNPDNTPSYTAIIIIGSMMVFFCVASILSYFFCRNARCCHQC